MGQPTHIYEGVLLDSLIMGKILLINNTVKTIQLFLLVHIFG